MNIRQISLANNFDKEKLLSILNRNALEDEAKLKQVHSILKQIRTQGDKALFEILKQIEGQDFTAENLSVEARDIKNSVGRIDKDLYKSLQVAAQKIKKYHQNQTVKSWFVKEKGIKSGMIVRPLERVGIYVPGGEATYPSTLLMNAIPAQIAGVEDIMVCTPANAEGKVNDVILATANILNIKKVYKIGGAQAIGAMAYGTETISKVDKISGPGNIYVTLAKKEVFGTVGIDMLAGPSEVVILADDEANPEIVASDMLAQAEHGSDAMAILITDSKELSKKVRTDLETRLKIISRDNAQKSLADFGLIIDVSDINVGLDVLNAIGAEHLVLYTSNYTDILPKVKTAGAIFAGKNSAVALGDYAVGPNHTLPTMGNAAFSSPLSVDDFLKKSSFLEVDEEGLEELASTVETIARAEGLDAHANSVEIRRKSND